MSKKHTKQLSFCRQKYAIFPVSEPNIRNWDIFSFFSKLSRLMYDVHTKQIFMRPHTADSGMRVKRQEPCELLLYGCEIKLAIHEHPIPPGKVESDGNNEDRFSSVEENSSC